MSNFFSSLLISAIAITGLAACGTPDRPSCADIAKTTYKVDVTRLTNEDRVSASIAFGLISEGLNTNFHFVDSCEGWDPCIRYEYTPESQNPTDPVACSWGPLIQIRKGAITDQQMGIYTIVHETLHSIREEGFLRPDAHEEKTDLILSRRYSLIRSKTLQETGILPEEKNFICHD